MRLEIFALYFLNISNFQHLLDLFLAHQNKSIKEITFEA
jgi:hypothetical protein